MYPHLQGGRQEDGAGRCLVVPSDRSRGVGARTEELPSERQETLFYREGDPALAHVVQEFVESPSLEIRLKSRLHMELGSCLQVASGGPCRPQPFCD